MNITNHKNQDFLRLNQLIGEGGLLPISRSTLYSWVADGKLPAPIKLSPRVSVWRKSDILAFVDKMEAK